MSISNPLEDYADDFVVYPLKNDPVVASGPASVLVSARNHLLTLATEKDPCRCQVPNFNPCGIGQMKIEQNFKIAKN